MNKHYKGFLIRFIVGIIIAAIAWKPLTSLVFTFYCGLDPRFDVGGGYEIWFPGYLVYFEPEKDIEDQMPLRLIYPETIEKVTLVDNWIIGSTVKGWFAVDKSQNNLYYPINTVPELESTVGMRIDGLTFLTEADLLPYEVRYDDARKLVTKIRVFLLALPILIGFMPNACRLLWTSVLRRKNLKDEHLSGDLT